MRSLILAAVLFASNRGSVRNVSSNPLPPLDGKNLRVEVVEVAYGPGGQSPKHTHSCPVVAYVVDGSIRTQSEGQPETIYGAGQTFYEAPNKAHLVSANASSTKPAKFVAFLICDHASEDK